MPSPLSELIERVSKATGADPELEEAVAKALGWQERKRTSLGLNGRTPGRRGWVPPEPPWTWRPRLPSLLGPRSKLRTLALLKALEARQKMGDLEQRLRAQIKRWEDDVRGCRRMERKCGRSQEWAAAQTFKNCAETMERVVQEAKVTLGCVAEARQDDR